LTAEVLAALRRENRALDSADSLLRQIEQVEPPPDLRAACLEALAHGAARGANLWHLALACQIARRGQRDGLRFASLDDAQRNMARRLGFPILPA
jgi:hypothetical protein